MREKIVTAIKVAALILILAGLVVPVAAEITITLWKEIFVMLGLLP